MSRTADIILGMAAALFQESGASVWALYDPGAETWTASVGWPECYVSSRPRDTFTEALASLRLTLQRVLEDVAPVVAKEAEDIARALGQEAAQ